MKTIAYQSDLSWFSAKKTRGRYSSPREALREHIQYITRPSECALSHNLKLSDWLRRADSYLAQRKDARIAGKRIFALPNSLSPGEGLNLLKEFLTTRELFSIRKDGKRMKVKLNEDDIGIAIHDSKGLSGEKNLHAHVVFSPKVKKGDKEYSLNLTKAELKGLYREWESFLKSKGYHLRKSPVKEPHYGPSRLRYDSRARGSYFHLSRAKRLWREAVEIEKLERMLERAVNIQVQNGELLTWDEIHKDERQESKTTRGREKVERKSPPPRPSRSVKQPVVNKVQPVQQPRSVQQPRLRVGLQRPSQQVQQSEQKTKDPVKQIREHVERELAQKRKKERQLANEINYSLKQQARTLSQGANNPSPQPQGSYSEEKAPQEVGMNPFVTQQVIEEREQEKEQQLKQVQVYQAEMRITYRYHYFQGELTVRFRTLSNWSAERRKGIAAFLASVAVAYLFGYRFPEEALAFYGKFVEREAVAVKEQVKKIIKKPFYSSSQEALKALSVKRVIHVRVRIWEGNRLVEEHNFYLMKESFTVLEKYASEVRRRQQPQPQPAPQPQAPQQVQPEPREPDEEPDWPSPGM